MKKLRNIIWGLILIAAGAVLVLNRLGVANIELFFEGWWTLFIIVPCTVGVFTERDKTGNLVGILVGVVLLLCCQDILDSDMIWDLIVPAIIIIIGLKMVLKGIRRNKGGEVMSKIKESGAKPRVCCATFSGCDVSYRGEVFECADLSAIFGGVECDLRGAVIQGDCAISVSAIFGGIDILVPDGINVKVSTTSLFGGVSNKTGSTKDAPTLYVSGLCLFGGVDIK